VEMWIFVGILIAVYILIFTEKISRALSALLGAIATIIAGIATGFFDFLEALTFINSEVIWFILGLMIIVEIIKHSGLFHFISISTLKKTGGHPVKLFIVLGLVTFLFAILTGNLTSMLICGSLTMISCEYLGYNPIPYLVSEIFISNVAGVSLVISSVNNILVASSFDIPFIDFAILGLPISLLLLGITFIYLHKLLSRKLMYNVDLEAVRNKASLETLDPWSVVEDKKSFYIALISLIVTIILFALSQYIGITLGFAALFMAVIMVLLTRVKLEDVFKLINWTTIFFFIGLFITIGGVEKAGALRALSDALIAVVGNNASLAVVILILLTGVLSAFVDNIPITLTFIPVIADLGLYGLPITPLIWALVLGGNLGGVLTPVGSPPGVIAMDIAEKTDSKIRSSDYFKLSLPLTFIYLGISIGYALII